MIKPSAPIKPKKPNLIPPTKSIVETFYIYHVSRWRAPSPGAALERSEFYEFAKDDIVPMIEEDGDWYPDGDYDKTQSIDLSVLLQLLKDKNIDIKDVVIDNQVYYRKSNGQLILHIAKELSDGAYEAWVNDNAAKLEKYERDKEQHPTLFAEYKKQKKLWDIHQAELKLQALKDA